MEVHDYCMSMNICREVEKRKCFPCASNPRTTHIISLCVQFCLLSSLFGRGGECGGVGGMGVELLISL